ncbi:3-isopropylmalate dehydrogenase [Nocardiopsis sp. CNT-189]|uniref:3-isopropylmalate dehydrogenase n=1 Tax=Nocardiopsis oceanisediminis TaxID=2816862 RepID=UPI003B2BD954
MGERTVKLAVIGGDGIGPEVVAEGLRVLSAVAPEHGLSFETTQYDLGARRWHATGETLTDEVEQELRGHDAILLGAVGDPSVPSGVLERGLLLRLRFAFSHYVNLRPVRLYPGVATPLADRGPDDIDMLVVREGTEGPYAGMGGVLRKGTPDEIATQDSVNTRMGVERVVRYAFAKAAERPRKKLTLVHKDNVLTYAGDLWQRVVRAVGEEYPQVSVDYSHVDAAAMFFVNQPERFDVIVTDNLFGDIITDIGAAVTGGIGLAASGNINPENAFPSMFEPVHGSAPDIAGQGKADPTATVLSVALMLDHLGAPEAARRVEQAVAEDLEVRAKEGSTRSTSQIGDDLVARVARQG